jgi:hypothetical protein
MLAFAAPPARSPASERRLARLEPRHYVAVMGFLWQLLPGARETRNQVAIGYAWLFAIALWVGVPTPSPGPLKEIADALGSVGVGIGVSFFAFVLGSVSDELIGALLKIRGGRPLASSGDVPLFLTIQRMEERGQRTQLERLEGSIDRGTAEVLLRVGLLLPVAVMAIAGGRTDWYYLVAGSVLIAALLWQAVRRYRDLQSNLTDSTMVRNSLHESLDEDPETKRFRERRKALLAEHERRMEEDHTRFIAESERRREAYVAEWQDRLDRSWMGELEELRQLGVRTETDTARMEALAPLQLQREVMLNMLSLTAPFSLTAPPEATRWQRLRLAASPQRNSGPERKRDRLRV